MIEDTNTIIPFLDRIHPEYDTYCNEWKFYKDTYDGGKAWFLKNIDKYFREGMDEYRERVDRAYRFNHTREVVDLVNKYIFKADVDRKEDAEDYIKRFWASATLQKRDIDHFMTMASAQASIFGRVWIVVDSNFTDKVTSVADVKAKKSRVYAYTVSPLDVLDLSFDEDGELNWIKIREVVRDDSDPFNYSGGVIEKLRIWTRNEWYLFAGESSGTSAQKWVLEDQGEHDLGIVPVTYLDHNDSDSPYTSTALIADIAYLDRKAANYLSNLDAIIQDQTFSQLVIPAEALAFADDDGDGRGLGQKLLEFGTKRIFLYHNGEGNNKPDYISPDPSNPETILNVVNKIIGEIYHSVGMAGERTKQDNAVGIDNSSGVAKAYDFERMNAMLANKAKALQSCENRMIKIVKAWNNVDTDPDLIEDYVTYSKDFDVRNLANEFDIAGELTIMIAPKTLRQEQMKGLVDKLWPQLNKATRDKIMKDIDEEWLRDPTPEEIAVQSASVQTAIGKITGTNSSQPKPTTTASKSKTGTQGQNNKPAK
jgi:hypothetical protein